MKTPARFNWWFRPATPASLFAMWILAITAATAVPPPPNAVYVIYDPPTETIEGDQPFSRSYTISVTSPGALPSVPTSVPISLAVLSVPEGASIAAAAAIVSFSQPVLTFNGPNETQQFTVYFNVPIGTATGDFKYHITTPGWPTALVDGGTYVNMHANPPALGLDRPVIQITEPNDDANYTYVFGGTPVPVLIRILSVASPEAPVQMLAASLSGKNDVGQIILAPMELLLDLTGLGSPTTEGVVTMPISTPGIYTITARATNLVGTSETTSTFTVVQQVLAPTVTISEPSITNYDYYLGSPALQIPFAFEAHSLLGGIRTLTATLNGQPVSFNPVGIGSLIATGSGTFSLATGGEYTLEVTATDDHGTAVDSTTFHINVITVPTELSVKGTVFFDSNGNGAKDADEYGLPGITVQLLGSGGEVVGTATTVVDGSYFFTVAAGDYAVVVQGIAGFSATTASHHPVIVGGADVVAPATGYGLNFAALRTLNADGNSHGFWKNNLSKAIAGKTKGVQISAAALQSYTSDIATLALEPFDGLTMQSALAALEGKGSDAGVLLAKQLVASEYNYANGAYIGGSGTITYAFIYWGEYVLKNSGNYSRSYLTFAKDWFDAYNNSHGGTVAGPSP